MFLITINYFSLLHLHSNIVSVSVSCLASRTVSTLNCSSYHILMISYVNCSSGFLSYSILIISNDLGITFEEPFGDIYGEGVWRGFSKTVTSNIHRIVVAFASFDGNFTVMCYFTISCLFLVVTS